VKSSRPMHVLAALAGFVLSAPGANADLVTANSVPIATPSLGIVTSGGTVLPALTLVSGEYRGLGLDFPAQPNGTAVAVTTLSGVNVWAPAGPAPGISPPWYTLDYSRQVSGAFVVPGTSTPMTVSSLTLEVMGGGSFEVSALAANGNLIRSEMSPTGTGPNGGELYAINDPGVRSFDVVRSGLPANSGSLSYAPWGISEVSFTRATAPEPGSLVLAVLGALGLATRFRRG
jgi:hypothetical protein